MRKEFRIPKKAVVLLVGVAGCGKSTLSKKAFGNSDKAIIVSSDECRKEICGNENDQNVTEQAFELFYKKIEEGLAQSKQVIADATNLDRFSRERIYMIADRAKAPVYALMFNVPLDLIKEQNKKRERNVPEYAINRMFDKMKKTYYDQIAEELPKSHIIDIIPSSKEQKGNSENKSENTKSDSEETR